MPKKRSRANGDGSIYWVEARERWAVTVTMPDGRRTTRFIRGAAGVEPPEARRKLRELQGQIGRNEPVAAKRETVAHYLTWWLDNVARPPGVSLRTFVRYENFVHKHLVPALGARLLAKLTATEIQGLYRAKLDEGLAENTVLHLHNCLHKALADAVRFDRVTRNVSAAVRRPRVRKQAQAFLGPDEARRFLEALATDRLRALYILALTTGMREGELLALRWVDVDLEGAHLTVQRSIGRVLGHGFVESPGKTEAGRRRIDLAPFAAAALSQHRERQAVERLIARKWADLDLVFPNTVGKPIEATNFRLRMYYPLLELAGLRRIRFHDLRHSTASLLFAGRVPAKVVQELLGHSSIDITMDVYTHLLPNMTAQASSEMEGLLGRGPSRN